VELQLYLGLAQITGSAKADVEPNSNIKNCPENGATSTKKAVQPRLDGINGPTLRCQLGSFPQRSVLDF